MVTYTRLALGPLDEVRVSVLPQPGATLMSVVADAFGGPAQGVHPAWRRKVREAVPGDASAVLQPLTARDALRIPHCLSAAAPLWETDPAVQLERLAELSPDVLLHELETWREDGPDGDGVRTGVPPRWRAVAARPRPFLTAYASLLRAVWQVLAPVWDKARPVMDRETQRVGVAAVSGALETVLSGLSPRVGYRPETLRVPDPHPRWCGLDGRRLVLVPVVSGHGASLFSLDLPDVVWLGYPVAELSSLWEGGLRPESADALTFVLGDLRARILRALTITRTMGELARTVACPLATATYHCGQLEAAALLTRERRKQHVWVSRTARGDALVDLLSHADP
ncbi:winged helix-turn-helix domain-containing protein [Streptomyces sp. TRM76323]|uniref:Winged helix-turn-helix domain-containing protein n=1 Tax=Streptomyces tamarix TaxID=3078565 RepID=A0ABU3QEJ7_9ACTN|nr:winged helix-turn-helix domain-containing protein [Streptomyces tamarix]MDT9681086.1 winged helix-turn-helix domain-containing protein [Streptomyces tamarix]